MTRPDDATDLLVSPRVIPNDDELAQSRRVGEDADRGAARAGDTQYRRAQAALRDALLTPTEWVSSLSFGMMSE